METINNKNCSICVVCLDTIDFDLNNYCVTSCNHSFHLDCLLLTKNNCPICKIQLIDNNENNLDDKNNLDEENNLDDEDDSLDKIIIDLINDLNDSKIKTKLTELKNNLLNYQQTYDFCENFNEYFYQYDLEYNLDENLCPKILKLKNILCDKFGL